MIFFFINKYNKIQCGAKNKSQYSIDVYLYIVLAIKINNLKKSIHCEFILYLKKTKLLFINGVTETGRRSDKS